MSSGLLALPTELLFPMEVGVAGLDRLVGASSDITKPAHTRKVTDTFTCICLLQWKNSGIKSEKEEY